MANKFSLVTSQIEAVQFGNVEIDPQYFARAIQTYIVQGSQRYNLAIDDLEVYANNASDYEGKEIGQVCTIGQFTVPMTLDGLLANGTKFMDAVMFLSLEASERPTPKQHPIPATRAGKTPTGLTWTTYANHMEIARCMFFYFFMVLTRAKAPTTSTTDAAEQVPNFLRSVLSINKTQAEVATYLASFNLNYIDHRWVRHVDVSSLSQEALSRFGLGVAGYRLAAPFKLKNPDRPGHEEFASAIEVARSIARSPASWDIHPATRDQAILTKYGNLNKNLGNLILKSYLDETINSMVESRILFARPTEEIAHTNYLTWAIGDIFSPTTKIFS